MTVKIDGTNTEANPAFTGADTDTGLQCGTNEVKLVTGGTARATVDSSGRLGVGTGSPSTLLHLETSGTGNAEFTVKNNNASPGSGRILFADQGASDAGVIQYEHSANAMVFKTDTNEAARLDSSGRFMVGTPTAPSVGTFAQTAKLVSQGNTTESVGGTVLSLQRGEAATSITSGEYLGNICFTDNAGREFARIDGLADGTAGGVNGNPGKLAFLVEVAGSDNGPIERFSIGNSGKFLTNNVQQYFDRGAAQGNSSFSRDYTLGGTQSCLVIAAFNHYGLFGYGCTKISFAATGSSFSTDNVHNYNSGNGGNWAISKPNNSTIRVTKNAGSYSGSGHWFIHVISS